MKTNYNGQKVTVCEFRISTRFSSRDEESYGDYYARMLSRTLRKRGIDNYMTNTASTIEIQIYDHKGACYLSRFLAEMIKQEGKNGNISYFEMRYENY